MTNTLTDQIDWDTRHAEHEARVAWLKAHLRKSAHGMESEYRVEVGDLRLFRMFRAPRNPRQWALVEHRPTEDPNVRKYDWGRFEIEGHRDGSLWETRERVLSWIAIRWDWAVDEAMKAV